MKLRTSEGELRLLIGVECNVLSAEKVVARAEACWDYRGDLGHLDSELTIHSGRVTVLIHLEPDITGGRPGDDILAIRHPSQIEKHWTGVPDRSAGGKSDASARCNSLHIRDWAPHFLIAAQEW